MKNLLLILFVLPIISYSQITNTTGRSPRVVFVRSVVSLGTGDSLIAKAVNGDIVTIAKADLGISVTAPTNEILYGTGTGISSTPNFKIINGMIASGVNTLNIVGTNGAGLQVGEDGAPVSYLYSYGLSNVYFGGVSSSIALHIQDNGGVTIFNGITRLDATPATATVGTFDILVRNTSSHNIEKITNISSLNDVQVIDWIGVDVNNSGTSETDLHSYTIAANQIANDGESIIGNFSGTFNDVTATSQLKMYFAGTSIWNTGSLTVSATGGWSVNVEILRTSSSTAKVVVKANTPGASTAIFTTYTSLSSLDFTTTNVLKVTGQAGGAGGGSSDITSTMSKIFWSKGIPH